MSDEPSKSINQIVADLRQELAQARADLVWHKERDAIDSQQLQVQLKGMMLAADQYSASRDHWFREAKRYRTILEAVYHFWARDPQVFGDDASLGSAAVKHSKIMHQVTEALQNHGALYPPQPGKEGWYE